MASETDREEILETALLVLSRVEPEMATAVWLQKVEEFTLEEMAAHFQCSERTVRRWLDGVPERGREDHVEVLGGIAILRIIVDLLEQAVACDSYKALIYAFHCASGRNEWGVPYTAALLNHLRAAKSKQRLKPFLTELKAAYLEQRFTGFVRDLLLKSDVQLR